MAHETIRVTLNRSDEFKVFIPYNSFQVWYGAVFLEISFVPRACGLLRRRLDTLHGEDICHVGLFFEHLLTFSLSVERLHVIGDVGDGEEVWWPTS